MATGKKNKYTITPAQKLGVGVGLTAAAVAAAGAYFLYGSENASKNRKLVKGWTLKAKGEVLSALEKAEHMSETEFKKLVDNVVATYHKAESLSKKDTQTFKTEMLDNWEDLVASGIAKVYEVKDGLSKQKSGSTKANKVAKKTVTKKATTKKAPAKKAPAKKVAKKAPAKKTAK